MPLPTHTTTVARVRRYTDGVSLESYEGELKPLPLKQLQELLERHAPRRPSLVVLCARHSTEAGHAFLHAGVPAVVCLRGYLPEEAIGEFVHAFYRALLTGSTPHAAFDLANDKQREAYPSPLGGFVLLEQASHLPISPHSSPFHDLP